MSLKSIIPSVFFVALMMFGLGGACAQTYPTKAIRIITTSPGSGADTAARLIAQGLSESFGQPVVVENRSGYRIVEGVVTAPADGYTLLLWGSSIWLTQYMRDNVPWDPLNDLAAVTLPELSPNVLVVSPLLPVKNVKELIKLINSKPGAMNYAFTPGASSHFAVELFKAMAHLNMVPVPYKGMSQAINEVISGRVHLMFAATASAMPLAKAGKLKALAVSGAKPSVLVPGLPTVAESLPGFESASIHGIFAPAKTAEPIIRRLNQEIVMYLKKPDVTQRFENMGMEVVASSPEELTNAVKSEMARLGKVIKDTGIGKK